MKETNKKFLPIGCLGIVLMTFGLFLGNAWHASEAKSFVVAQCQKNGGLLINQKIPTDSLLIEVNQFENVLGKEISDIEPQNITDCDDSALCLGLMDGLPATASLSVYKKGQENDEFIGQDKTIFVLVNSISPTDFSRVYPQLASRSWTVRELKKGRLVASYKEYGYNGSLFSYLTIGQYFVGAGLKHTGNVCTAGTEWGVRNVIMFDPILDEEPTRSVETVDIDNVIS